MWPVSRFFSVVIVLAVAGCASWSGNRGADDAFEQALQLPTSTLGSNGLVLEVAQITVDRPSELLAEVWQATDEQHLPAATRKRLNDNGMRCGRLGVKLPTVLDTLIAESRQPAEDDPLNVTSRVRVTMVRTREGKEKELPVGATHPEFVVLRRDNDALRGETLPQAQCVLRVRPKWDGDGVNLSVSPGILYGQLKQSWAGQDGAWQLKS
ncbi:MAG: hypothetical protein QF805_26105, partial [Pirellulaceae bacterium]|nr:hypothetical protein [Pirellulaceae bacterium]